LGAPVSTPTKNSLPRIRDLFGGLAFTKTCKISLQGKAFPVHTLIDTGAQIMTLLHPKLRPLVKQLQAKPYKLNREVGLSAFDNKPTAVATKLFQANLAVDSRRFPTWFVYADTGKHDMIIGQKWLAQNRIFLDTANRRLVYPEEAQLDAQRNLNIAYNVDSLQRRLNTV
jgi:predicted aspartyl protease